METISREERAVMQQHIDKIKQSCAVLNKMGLDVTDILDETRSLTRYVMVECAQDINELPNFPAFVRFGANG